MKLNLLYSNRENIFPTIAFHKGFNVIFAQVKDPTIKTQDSHNLGKTFLIKVIDFALLGSIDKEHPFKQHQDIFGEFIFFIEIETVKNEYITIKRAISGRNSINIFVNSTQSAKDLRILPDSSWTYHNLSLDNARTILNDLVALEAIKPFEYRKGLGYFLRRQSDYDEIFRISKFQYGPDKYWKPFVALLLGFDQEVINQKYDEDDYLKKLDDKLILAEDEAGSKSEEYDEIRGLLEIRQKALEKIKAEIETFSFHDLEAEINTRSINEIETEIASLNERRYTIDYEIQEIEKSLETKLEFNFNQIEEIFKEANLVFPDSVKRSYEELVEFNRRLSSGRFERLKVLKAKLSAERENIELQLKQLDDQRKLAFRILHQRKTLEKYKQLQKILVEREKEVIEFQQQLIHLDHADNIQKEIQDKRLEQSETISQIRRAIRSDNPTFSKIRTTFSDYVESIIGVQALLSVNVNQQGNLEFNVRTLDRDILGRETSEAQGTSYKKILAACFDLALLSVFSNSPFYRFVYHDGIFEGLDNRKKVNLLNLVRDICKEKGIQYILTVIDSDLPRNEQDQKLLFTKDEVVLYLHDQGADGRLFKTQAF